MDGLWKYPEPDVLDCEAWEAPTRLSEEDLWVYAGGGRPDPRPADDREGEPRF